MKLNIIPDVHGDSIWKYFIDESCDKIVFLGDLVDSFTIQNEQMLKNLLDIIEFKRNNPDKVILLWGNHDIQYLYYPETQYQCSGLRPEFAFNFKYVFKENQNLFQYAYQYSNWIFTHAGIQHYWFTENFNGDVDKNIADQINNVSNRTQKEAIHQVGYMRGGMRHNVGGILWCDRQELKKPLEGFNQVVGHTAVPEIKEYNFTNKHKVLFCDCLTKIENPIIIEIND